MKAPDKRPHDRQLTKLENAFIDDLSTELQVLASGLTSGITSSSVGDIEARLNDADRWQRVRDVLARHFQVSAEYGVEIGAGYVETELLGVKFFSWDIANDAAIAWALEQANDLALELQKVTTPRIMRLVAEWIDNSEPIGTLFEQIIGNYGYSEERAQTIAVTEVTRAFAQGNIEAWQESGIVQGQRWSTNADELVCTICAPLNGTVALLGEPFEGGIEFPPAHPRCRCWLRPVVDMVKMAEVKGITNEHDNSPRN